MEAKYGYDTKHAMHLFRLLIQGREILEYGDLNVDRTDIDADLLKSVRAGELSYDQLMEQVEEMRAAIKESEENTTLPDQPNFEEVNQLCIETIKHSLTV